MPLVFLFGAKKLPEIARAMGSSVTQFKKGLDAPDEEPAKQIDGGPWLRRRPAVLTRHVGSDRPRR